MLVSILCADLFVLACDSLRDSSLFTWFFTDQLFIFTCKVHTRLGYSYLFFSVRKIVSIHDSLPKIHLFFYTFFFTWLNIFLSTRFVWFDSVLYAIHFSIRTINLFLGVICNFCTWFIFFWQLILYTRFNNLTHDFYTGLVLFLLETLRI